MPGIGELLPFIVIVLVLFLRGDALPTRGAIISGRLPFAPTPGRMSLRVVGPIAIAVTFVALLLLATPNGRLGITNTLVGIVISLSFVVLTGFVGQISLAQLVLAGVSGFLLSKFAEEQNIPFPISPLLAAARCDAGRSARRHPRPAGTRRQPRHRHVRVRRGDAGVHVQEPDDQRRANGSRVRAPGRSTR